MLTQLLHFPPVAAIDFHFHSATNDGIAFAGHGFDQGGFSAPVRPQDGDMFSRGDGKVYILQHYLLAARNIHVAHAEEFCRRLKFSAVLRRRHHDWLTLDRVKATWLIRPPLL